MLSQAARTYDRSKKIKPLSKKQRQKMYAAKSVIVQRKNPEKKFSPFNTVSRDARDSYLLRVTNEPNTQTNYEINGASILPLNRRPTIDQSNFERIIGDVHKQDFSIQLAQNADHRCVKSQISSSEQKRPFTVRDHQKWRQTFEQLDFQKKPSTKRIKLFPKLTLENSTDISFMRSLRNTIESNFNNYDRFKFQTRQFRAHSFRSDFGHEYLKQVEKRDKSPEYNIQVSNESYIRPSMSKPKGFIDFKKYKKIIATRFDRNDPEWHTKLNYETLEKEQNPKTINFGNSLDRCPNDIHSKYPIRLSLQKIIKLKDT